jgi:glycoprotein-N-acetylgalactosamine 3-beta-galactosyltransferase
MWQKVRSTWAYVHENYLEKYDWFFISGDDTFVIAENLRHAAAQYPVDKTPIYLGSPAVYPPHPHWLCCSGGAGYTLNRAALRILYSKLTWTGCHPHDITSEEDRLIGTNCFRNIITCTASVDEIGEDRFHSLNTDFHAKWTLGVPAPWQPVTMRKYHHVTVKTEMESVSETRVTFHLNEAKNDGSYLTRSQSTSAVEGMRRYHAIVHGLCK